MRPPKIPTMTTMIRKLQRILQEWLTILVSQYGQHPICSRGKREAAPDERVFFSLAKRLDARSKRLDKITKKLDVKSKAFNLQKLTLARTCRTLYEHNEALTQLKKELDELNASPPPAPCQDGELNPFIEEMRRHAGKHPSARRYGAEMYDFAYGIKAISPKAYMFTREGLPLPSLTSIRSHSQWETTYIASALRAETEAGLSQSLQEYRNLFKNIARTKEVLPASGSRRI
jgi:hypothetical protein